jgi:protein-L-isoaspartate(D-aspartate) O-methyltransferase
MTPSSDDKDFAVLRHRMVQTQLRGRGLDDERLLHAMATVPRHLFVPDSYRWSAYKDEPLPIGHLQTISQPYMVACMTDQLQLVPNAKVLEVGTGSGYQAAVLAEMGCRVWTIERHAELAHQAEERLLTLGYTNIRVITGDGSLGLPDEAPFDGIIVAAAAPQIPQALRDQLRVGGRMVIPIRAGEVDELTMVERLPQQSGDIGASYREVLVVGCTFVPLIGKQGYDK